MAAVIVILMAALWVVPKQDDSSPTRGDAIELRTPTAAIGQPLRLAWSTRRRAPRFTVVVISPVGGELFRTTTNLETVTIPASVTGHLLPGTTYSWTVTALDATGQRVTSAKGTLVIAAANR